MNHRNALKNIAPVIIIALIATGFPIVVNFGVASFTAFPTAGSQGDWIGFWGSYAGGIFTLITVYWVITEGKKEKRKEHELRIIEKDVEEFNSNFEEFEKINKYVRNIDDFFSEIDSDEESQLDAVNKQLEYNAMLSRIKRRYTSLEARNAFDEYEKRIAKYFANPSDEVEKMFESTKIALEKRDKIKKVFELSTHLLYRRIEDLKTRLNSYG